MVRVVEEVESVRGKGFVSKLSSVSSVSSIYIYMYIYRLCEQQLRSLMLRKGLHYHSVLLHT